MTLYERIADLTVWLVIAIATGIIGTVLGWCLMIAILALIQN